MKQVYKFENHIAYTVDARVLNPIGASLRKCPHSFIYMGSRLNTTITPIPKKVTVHPNKECSYTGWVEMNDLVNNVDNITFDDKLYLHSNCTIPRAKVTQKYTRVLKADKADICVVPERNRTVSTAIHAIFINKIKDKVYIIETRQEWSNGKNTIITPEICATFPLGSGVLDINPSLKNTYIEERYYHGDADNTFSQENWHDFLDSTLLFCGHTASLSPTETWIADVLYNKLHDVVTEDLILPTLGDSTNQLTKESYNSFKEMLNSSDATVVGLGLKAIAEMDYEKYYNTTIHLLCNNKDYWTTNSMRKSSSVKYMLNFLGLWRYPRESYADTTTQEDFALMQEVVEADFTDKVHILINSFEARFPFVNLELDYKFTVAPKLEEFNVVIETTEDEAN